MLQRANKTEDKKRIKKTENLRFAKICLFRFAKKTLLTTNFKFKRQNKHCSFHIFSESHELKKINMMSLLCFRDISSPFYYHNCFDLLTYTETSMKNQHNSAMINSFMIVRPSAKFESRQKF